MKRIVFALFFTLLQSVNLFADDYKIGDIIRENGLEYEVLVTYLVVDAKETHDSIKGPESFYQAGELMVTKVNENFEDVVIPTHVGRFEVIGLADSLFYNHTHNRIWLPNLLFAGTDCFAKLKINSGALVIHDIGFLGMSAFDELQGDIIFDTDKSINWNYSFRKIGKDSTLIDSRPLGMIKFNTKNMRFIKTSPVFDDCYTAQGKNYKKWIDQAFNYDAEFQKNDLTNKAAYLNKKVFWTTPQKEKKGLIIKSSTVGVFHRHAKYTVINKKKRKKAVEYKDFVPVADATQKGGWYVKFIGDEGEVKYQLNGILIKGKK